MAKSKYYIDFSDSIKTLSKEVNNANDFYSKIPEKDDITDEFNRMIFIRSAEIGDNYSVFEHSDGIGDIGNWTAKVKDSIKNVQIKNDKREMVSSVSEFKNFTSEISQEMKEINTASTELATLIKNLSNKLKQVDVNLKKEKISGKSIADFTESINILDKI